MKTRIVLFVAGMLALIVLGTNTATLPLPVSDGGPLLLCEPGNGSAKCTNHGGQLPPA